MSILRTVLRRLRSLFGRRRFEDEMADEMRCHLEMQEAANRTAGMDPDEARCAARRQFGHIDGAKEAARDQRRLGLVEDLARDLRFAVRMLAKTPGATALSIVSIALGIGATTALFSLADEVLFNPFPFPKPHELYNVYARDEHGRFVRFTWRDYEVMSQAGASFGQLAASSKHGFLLERPDGEETLAGRAVSSNMLTLIGARTVLGGTALGLADGVPQVVISHRLWRKDFSSAPSIVGRHIRVNRRDCVVSGVLRPDYGDISRLMVLDLWIGAETQFQKGQKDVDDYEFVMRLNPGVRPRAVAAALDASIRGPGGRRPAPVGVPGTRLGADYSMNWTQKAIGGGVLLALLSLLLFVSCANVAQMKLAQAEARKREFAMRIALGSGPWAVARQLLIEAGLLSTIGAAWGVLLAQGLLYWLNLIINSITPWFGLQVRLDWDILGFSAGATAAALLLAGLAPARLVMKLDLTQVLQLGQGTGRTSGWLQRALISGQTAISVAIFGLAVLFLQSFHHAAAVRPGFDPDKSLLVMNVAPGLGLSSGDWANQAGERLAALPGVKGVAAARCLPLTGSGNGQRVSVDIPGGAPLACGVNSVGPNYFAVMGTRLLAGRGFEPRDANGGTAVAVISRELAGCAFGGRDPIGEWLVIDGQKRQITGVTEDLPPSANLHEHPQPYVYLPYEQKGHGELVLFVEAAQMPDSLAPSVRSELKRFDPEIAFFQVKTLRQHLDFALFPDRAAALVTTTLGSLGFLLTAAGLFGVLQFAVNRRTREIGVRMALGADRREVRWMILRESLRTIAWGLVLGLVLLAMAARFFKSAVLDVSPLDPWTYGISAAAAVLVALAAAWLPALRATKIDPVEALRAE